MSISVYTTFPASLLHVQPHQRSELFHLGARRGAEDFLEDGVNVSKDGFVYPAVSLDLPFSNGATFLPNTMMMQEMIRSYFDQYLEALEGDSSVKPPLILSVSKGVPIPTALTLFREHSSRFFLQPSYRMPLIELNSLLDTFYSKYADINNSEQWLDENQYEDAFADDAEAQWMAK